jgi:hypothetical protein
VAETADPTVIRENAKNLSIVMTPATVDGTAEDRTESGSITGLVAGGFEIGISPPIRIFAGSSAGGSGITDTKTEGENTNAILTALTGKA